MASVRSRSIAGFMVSSFIVPMLCVGMPFWRLCVLFCGGSQRGASGDALPKQSVGTMKW